MRSPRGREKSVLSGEAGLLPKVMGGVQSVFLRLLLPFLVSFQSTTGETAAELGRDEKRKRERQGGGREVLLERKKKETQ